MATILPYDPKVEILWATLDPAKAVTRACSVTQKGVFAQGVFAQGVELTCDQAKLIQFLYHAGHGNPLEHAVISFDITQISRACADQLRTHRMASHTMSSTHYQDHTGYKHRVSREILADADLPLAIETAMHGYDLAIRTNLPKEDARQLLPLSTEARMILTINARSLMHFLPLRMCYRNTIETILLAERLRKAAYTWFPELVHMAVKPCDYEGCKEGKMKCDFAAVEKRLEQYA